MTNTARALYRFFSGFGIPAYLRSSIPDNAEPPYITYEIMDIEPLSSSMFHAWVWYRDTSMAAISEKCDEIKNAIGLGVSIPAGNGNIILYPLSGVPFAQIQPDPDETIKAAYLSMTLLANTD